MINLNKTNEKILHRVSFIYLYLFKFSTWNRNWIRYEAMLLLKKQIKLPYILALVSYDSRKLCTRKE